MSSTIEQLHWDHYMANAVGVYGKAGVEGLLTWMSHTTLPRGIEKLSGFAEFVVGYVQEMTQGEKQ